MAAITPVYDSSFSNPSAGWHVFRIEEVKEDRREKDGAEKVSWIIKSTVEGGDSDGLGIQDWIGQNQKGDFGKRKLLGLMDKSGLDISKITDSDQMQGEKFLAWIKRGLEGKLFGGFVELQKSTKDESKQMANITKYATVAEAREKMQGQKAKPPAGQAVADGQKSTPPAGWGDDADLFK